MKPPAHVDTPLVPGLLPYLRETLRHPARSCGFYLRRSMRWSRGAPELPRDPKDDAFADHRSAHERAAAEQRAEQLGTTYHLTPLRERSSLETWRSSLALLDYLERLVPAGTFPDRPLRSVDVGAGDWHYVFALERFLAHRDRAPDQGPRAVDLSGIEIDGHVVYRDLHSRADWARARAGQTGNPAVRYRVGDFLTAELPTADVVTLFYPFVTSYALLAWGLPVLHFKPRRMFARAAALLGEGGVMIVLHQTSEEQERGEQLASGLPLEIVARTALPTTLVEDTEEVGGRCGTVYRPRPI